MNFATLKGLTIPEGVVKQITDASGRVMWTQAPSGVTVSITGNGYTYANVIIDGVIYNTASEIVVPLGTVITCVTQNSNYGGSIKLNYESVASGKGARYEYTVVSDVTIGLGTEDPSGMGYVTYGTITIVDENAPDVPIVQISNRGSGSGYASVVINGVTYSSANTIVVQAGTVITCKAMWAYYSGSYIGGGKIMLNGETVASPTSTASSGTTTYEYTVVRSVQIDIESNRMQMSSSSSVTYGNVTITEL